jgi:hypothetical protein
MDENAVNILSYFCTIVWNSINNHNINKANVGDSYTKEESDNKYLTEHQSLSNYTTKEYVHDALLSIIGNAPESLNTFEKISNALSDYVKLSYFDSILSSKVDYDDVYRKNEIDNLFQPKGNYLTEHQNISNKANVGDSYTKKESDQIIKQIITEIDNNDEVVSEALNTLYDKINENEEVTASSLINIYQYLNKLKNNVNYILENGVEITPDTPTPVTPSGDGKNHKLYYGNLSIKFENISQLSSLRVSTNTTGKFTISNIDCNDLYFYIICESSKSLTSVITENNENITDEFEEYEQTYLITIDDEEISYKVYEFKSEISLDAKINIKVN